ncbi:hypothetical protein LZZ90_03125 [Flavobacterium sp. SM15]|uniref:transglutaminase domain-containing protein n=1 Tax=Flavobacterium sp. SM15 TaxID=2908005 RepID=UPI001EDC53D4|nr:transglutaminase domain-containing protein [Flavobacterium sp. SM15]MCG2610497.1 hypothetical protein [Flavobacterium sp. SM15]
MRIKLLITSLLISTIGSAQKNLDPTPEDISLAKSIREKNNKADVAILNSNELVTFDLNSKEGKVIVNHSIKEKWMNINHRADIRKYEFYDSQSEIESFDIKFRNDKKTNFYVTDEFYKSEDLFYNDARIKYTTIDFPVQGYTYNYNFEKKYKDVKYFTSIFFNDEYPVIKKQVTIEVPKWLELEIKEFNFKGYKINLNKAPNDKSETTTYTYTIEELPASSNESNTPGPSYLYPHILIIAKSYTKDGKKNTLFNSTADLYKWYKSLVDTMKETPDALKEKVEALTKNAKTDEEKIKKIYYWVQDNIRYIAFEDGIAGFKPDESQNVFQKRYGDCKGMANLTKQMLKLAGFDARLTWIGTKRIAYDYSTPSLSVDNHMICTLFHNNKKYFLDGTEKFNSFGEYAERIQGKEVLIENGDNFYVEKVPVANSLSNSETFTSILKIENEMLVGKTNTTYAGESKASFLHSFNNIRSNNKETALMDYLSDSDKNNTISNIKTSDLTNRDGKISIDYDIKLNNKVSAFDNEIYVDLDFKKEFSKLSLKDRKCDFEFPYKENYSASIKLEIPAGYKVTKLPEPLSISTENYKVSITCQQVGNEIVYSKLFDFKNGTIKVDEFSQWNTLLDKINKIYNEQITLTKS